MTPDPNLHLAVALDGAGWHPAAWGEDQARPRDLWQAGYWVDLVRTAERGLLDFVTIEDGFGAKTDRHIRLDAVMIAARVAPLTTRIGLVPTVTVTHTEPFHIAKAIATLDFVSGGRAGVRVKVSGRPQEAALFGRRDLSDVSADELFEEAGDFVEVLRRLWDSWEDEAEIRDATTGRFVDRDKLHYIDFEGRYFSVKGPSITPRPPQGQPLVTALAHSSLPYRFAAAHADVVFVTPQNGGDARRIVGEIGRRDDLTVMADVVVVLAPTAQQAQDRKGRLDEMLGEPYRSDAHVHVGPTSDLADLMEEWSGAGIQGFRLRPAGLPHDLDAIVEHLIPELQRRQRFRTNYDEGHLRQRFGLDRPANRYQRQGPPLFP